LERASEKQKEAYAQRRNKRRTDACAHLPPSGAMDLSFMAAQVRSIFRQRARHNLLLHLSIYVMGVAGQQVNVAFDDLTSA